MKHIRLQTRLMGYFLSLSLFITPTLQCYDQAFLDHIANSNLNTFEVIDKEKDAPKAKGIHEQSFAELMTALITPRKFEYQLLNGRDKRETTFKQAPSSPQPDSAVVDTSFVTKMELVHGETRPADHLAHRLISHNGFDLISTEFGKKRCMEMLSQPIATVQEIQHRQAIIRELALNDDLRDECEQVLKQIKASEDLLFDLYQYDAIPESERVLYFGPFFDGLGWNKSNTALSVTTRLQQVMNVVQDAIFIGYAWFVPKFIFRGTDEQNKTARMVTTGILGCILTVPITLIVTSVQKQMINMSENIQQKLIGTATYINGINRLIQIMAADDEITPHMPKLREIAQQLNGSRRKSAQFNELCALLKESTFAPGDPSFFSTQGNVLMAYQHMVNEVIRREFTDAVNLLGEIDLYVALAKKMKIHQKLPVHYSFVQFAETSNPSISAKRFWNPFLPVETVVANDIEFSAAGMSNMILTGPNTGGKSAMLKALMINVLLAQTFGITASDQLTITPFTKLTCHMNITDDTGAGISLFKAEVQRAHELMDMVRKLDKNTYAFIIIDEIFTGTSPDKAEELSYKFIQQLNGFPNVIFVSATHFKKLTGLEQETNGRCKNYHMSVITDDSGKVIKYTYTLAQGPSPVNNAAQIAHEEGIF